MSTLHEMATNLNPFQVGDRIRSKVVESPEATATVTAILSATVVKLSTKVGDLVGQVDMIELVSRPSTPVQPSLDERFMTPEELAQHYAQGMHDHEWGAHPDFIRNDWKLDVMHDNTQRGYWDWVAQKIEEAWEAGVEE